ELSDSDLAPNAARQDGQPRTPKPLQASAEASGRTEADILARLRALQDSGIIKRLGLVVRHHELGYRANAMVVWAIEDGRMDEAGALLAGFPWVTLCYQRPRRPPLWPYNLFCMVHGRDRVLVRTQVAEMAAALELERSHYDILFSRRRFKQRGARYAEGPWTTSTAA
ncbi:MAG: AsnC family protein, partial [Rhodospirillales bacterium]|nr:AsnC family protein [Rhodospirillales bacterium]